MEQPIKILFLENNPEDVLLIKKQLSSSGLNIDDLKVKTEKQFKSALITFQPQFIISDINLPEFDGNRVLKIRSF